MKKFAFYGALSAIAFGAGMASAGTLEDVKARGELLCGSNAGLAGFAAPDAAGVYQGFDIAMCRAIAAAVLGDPMKVKVVPLSSETRFTALSAGEVDLLARTSTWTFSRDTDLKLDFVAVNYYDGQGFMVKKSLGVASAKELDGATVCIRPAPRPNLTLPITSNRMA
jgi:general L-amino acid transport system substrate-binding protein